MEINDFGGLVTKYDEFQSNDRSFAEEFRTPLRDRLQVRVLPGSFLFICGKSDGIFNRQNAASHR
jgi:hypothetical protein